MMRAILWKESREQRLPSVILTLCSIPILVFVGPLFNVTEFSQAMPRFDVLPRFPEPGFLDPAPTEQANTTQQPLNTALPGVRPGDTGPIEGRPPGAIWAHQDFATLPPKIAVKVSQEGAKTNTAYNPGVPSAFNSGINPATPIPNDPNAAFYGTNTVYVPLKNGTIQRIAISPNLHPWQNQYVLGPGTFGMDASIAKTVPIKERVQLRLQADFFQVLNNPGIATPGSNGIISLQNSSNAARVMQLIGRLSW